MSTTTQPVYRELDERIADGTTVRLLWEPDTHRTFVYVIDARTTPVQAHEAEVKPANARHAFEHPFLCVS